MSCALAVHADIIDTLHREALRKCQKRIEEMTLAKRKGVNRKSYLHQDYGFTASLKIEHGL